MEHAAFLRQRLQDAEDDQRRALMELWAMAHGGSEQERAAFASVAPDMNAMAATHYGRDGGDGGGRYEDMAQHHVRQATAGPEPRGEHAWRGRANKLGEQTHEPVQTEGETGEIHRYALQGSVAACHHHGQRPGLAGASEPDTAEAMQSSPTTHRKGTTGDLRRIENAAPSGNLVNFPNIGQTAVTNEHGVTWGQLIEVPLSQADEAGARQSVFGLGYHGAETRGSQDSDLEEMEDDHTAAVAAAAASDAACVAATLA